MQDVIRNGTLRLMTSETSCDVILSCQGHRLMAHKIILSIASPLLQELLLGDSSEISLLVFPDINASTMANILDYIYTGSVLLHAANLADFLSVASLLKLRVESDPVIEPKLHPPTDPNGTIKYNDYNYEKYPAGYDPRYKPNFEYKNPICGPECYENYPGYKSKEQVCDYKAQDKRLKFSPIILQDERIPNLTNGNRLNENKLPVNYLKTKELSPMYTNLDHPNPQQISLPKDYPPSFVRPEQNGIHSDATLRDSVIPLVPNSLTPTLQNGAFSSMPISADGSDNPNSLEIPKKKTLRKVPNLMPISKFTAFKSKKGLYNKVFPSPWSPRINPMVADPRNEYIRDKVPITPVPNDYPPPPIEPINGNIEPQNDSNNNFKSITYTHLTTPIAPLTETALNLIYREKHPSPPYTLQPSFESHNYTGESKGYATSIIDSGESQSYPYSNQHEIIYTSESNSSSCLSDIRVDDDLKKSEEEKEEPEKPKPYKCEDCGKQFSQLRNYKYHRSVHEGTKEFAARCPECGKTFNDRGYLSSHLKIHRDRKEYGCPHCPKRFNQRVAYNMHLRIHTGVKPHVCPTCGKSFSRKMLLKQHQRVHTGERPYTCPECGKSFADRSNMSLHARLHTGVKPYACTLCPKSFTKKHHLKTHMNYHTGLKPYECQKCGLTFSQSSNMRTHYKKCIQKPAPDENNTINNSNNNNNSNVINNNNNNVNK